MKRDEEEEQIQRLSTIVDHLKQVHQNEQDLVSSDVKEEEYQFYSTFIEDIHTTIMSGEPPVVTKSETPEPVVPSNDKSKNRSAPPMKRASHTNLNGTDGIKNECISPTGTPPDLSSRSNTPSSSQRGTPPDPIVLNSRNYSDFMRNLAAKYNNNNNNNTEAFYQRNGTPPIVIPKKDIYMTFNQPPLVEMSSTQALLQLVRQAKEAEVQKLLNRKRNRLKSSPSVSSSPSPLDLSGSSATKRVKLSPSVAQLETSNQSEMNDWSVDDVCRFVGTIDTCAEYAPMFREQRIDGGALPLLTEDHLTSTLQMKLGPALKLRAILIRKFGPFIGGATSSSSSSGVCTVCSHCIHCHNISINSNSSNNKGNINNNNNNNSVPTSDSRDDTGTTIT